MDVYDTLLKAGRTICDDKYKISKISGSNKTKYTLYFYKGFFLKKILVKVIVLVDKEGKPDNKIELYFKSLEYNEKYKQDIKRLLRKYLPSSTYFKVI